MKIKCIKSGVCSFKDGDSLKKQTEEIPHGLGVYRFRKNTSNGDILYIGKSGTILQQGIPKAQELKKRLNNQQAGIQREKFLLQKLKEDKKINKIIIEWFIIDAKKHLPGFVEAKLLQEYYSKYSRLPIWNKEF